MAPGPEVLLGLSSHLSSRSEAPCSHCPSPGGRGGEGILGRAPNRREGTALSRSLCGSHQKFGYVLDSKVGAEEEMEKSRAQSTTVWRTAAPAFQGDADSYLLQWMKRPASADSVSGSTLHRLWEWNTSRGQEWEKGRKRILKCIML